MDQTTVYWKIMDRTIESWPANHKYSPASPSSAWGFRACTTGSLSMHHRDVTQTACFQNKYFIKGVMSPATLSALLLYVNKKTPSLFTRITFSCQEKK